MDPMMLIPWIAAVVFALLSMWLWRRAADAEERVAELEAQLKKRAPSPPSAKAEDEEEEDEEEEDEEEEQKAAPPEEEDEEEDEEEEDDDEEEEEQKAAEPAAKQEPPEPAKSEPPKSEPAKSEPAKSEPAKSEPAKSEPAKSEPPKSAPPKAAAPAPEPAEPVEDPLRKEAAKVVRDALELARYLDFDAIIEPPTTYRVTVPITAANGKAVRYLSDDMFPALKKITIEGSNAILHVDTAKPAP